MKNRFYLTAALLGVLCASAHAQSERVQRLVGQLTQDEKISLLSGSRDPKNLGQAGYLPGVPRLGIPELRLTDGPAGVRVAHPATALPAPVALAASFSPTLARRYGQVLGREGRALEQDILLSPMTNIVRVPQAGRNFETFGEDPLLASKIVEEEIRGIQSEGLIATIKHFAANNFERDRNTIDAIVDERTLREIYLPAFQAAIQAGAGSVMGSYNRLNGTFACENPFLLDTVLRQEWGFTGFVMSDWFATHSTGPALTAGLDMEMPGSGMGNFGPPSFFGAKALASVPAEQIDRAVARILTSLEAVGLLDKQKPRPSLESIAEGDAKAAREIAIAGSVLLKNEKNCLPLSKSDLQSVAVIGSAAKTPMIGGGGSASVVPLRSENFLTALARRTGSAASYVSGTDLDGQPVPASALKLDGTESLNFVGDKGLKPEKYTWSGTLTAPSDGTYALKLQVKRGTARLTLDGKPLIATGMFFGGNDSLLPTNDGLKNGSVAVTLKAGEAHQVTITASAGGPFPGMPAPDGLLEVRLAWVTPERRAEKINEAVSAAKKARTALVFAYDEGTEGSDRESLGLPGDQDALIAAVAAANPRTVVVLSTGSCVTMPWLSKVAAALETWFPGQEGADATAAMLSGEAEPGGRLPVTFPQRLEDAPTAPEARYPGVGGKAVYSEGIFVGYRHYDQEKVRPLFPFGHGLSYTRFTLSGLKTETLATKAGRKTRISFIVKNVGKRAGVAIPQVYLGAPDTPPVPMATNALVGFERVSLEPGESRTVTLTLGDSALSYWSAEKHAWAAVPGSRPIRVGFSSRDLPLTGRTQ